MIRYRNLSEFINELRRQRELVVVDARVDPYLEIAEIHRRVIAAGGPALLFSNVKDSSFPVVTNLFGTPKRVEMAFGGEPQRFVAQAARLPEELLPPSFGKFWRQRHFFKQALRVGFRRVSRPPVLEHHIPGADLTRLPALTSWPEDGGPFLTLPLVQTRGQGNKPENLGMYRIQIHDARESGVHFQIGKGGGYHLLECEQKNVAMPMSIFLGGPPALILAAIAPLPENLPETLFAALCAGHRLGRTSLPGHPLELIAEAEFALVGEVPPRVRRPEGPFGDHYGYYSLQHDYPVFRPRHIYHRRGAVFPATVVGKPRQEDFYLGDLLQEILSPLFPVVMPNVIELWSYGETGYHALSGARIRERYGREALSAVFRILGEGQLSLTKFLLATDGPVSPRNFRELIIYILERADFRTDLMVWPNTAMDTLDYAGPEVNRGSKGVLLGLGQQRRQLPGEFQTGGQALPPAVRNVAPFCPGVLVVEVPPYERDPSCVTAIAAAEVFAPWPLIVAVDNLAATLRSEASFLWTAFTRFEPAADLHPARTQTQHHRISYEPPLVLDARMKPWYPKELFCDPETRQLVSCRWREYFATHQEVVMGDSDDAHLGQSKC